jgi:prepilin-type N-terminal cleavage/methylation domain-containing protein
MNMKRNGGFTLIELLVVIMVIAVLAGLLFAGVTGGIKIAKRHEAQTTITALANCFRAYHTEYGYWPTNVASNIKVDDNIINLLQGSNPKRIPFMEVSDKKRQNPTSGTGAMVTPWYRSAGVNDNHRYYWCRFDVIECGTVTAGNPATTVRSGVAIWTTEPFPNRMLASW